MQIRANDFMHGNEIQAPCWTGTSFLYPRYSPSTCLFKSPVFRTPYKRQPSPTLDSSSLLMFLSHFIFRSQRESQEKRPCSILPGLTGTPCGWQPLESRWLSPSRAIWNWPLSQAYCSISVQHQPRIPKNMNRAWVTCFEFATLPHCDEHHKKMYLYFSITMVLVLTRMIQL